MLQIWKLELREIKEIVQSNTVRKWWTWDCSSGLSDFKALVLITSYGLGRD